MLGFSGGVRWKEGRTKGQETELSALVFSLGMVRLGYMLAHLCDWGVSTSKVLASPLELFKHHQ